MPPRVRYAAHQILDAALSLTQGQGIGAVTARSVAAALGCSTGPIFTHFASMDDLLERLMEQIMARFMARLDREPADDPLVAAGLGWLGFAREEPQLYAAIFLTPHPWHAKWNPLRQRMAQRMAAHPRYAHLDAAARFALVGRASIVMHGVGLEIWSGRLPTHDLMTLIQQLAAPVVDAALAHGWTYDLHLPAPQPPSEDGSKGTT